MLEFKELKEKPIDLMEEFDKELKLDEYDKRNLKQSNVWFGVFKDNALIGFICGRPFKKEPKEKNFFIFGLYLKREFRGKGIGEKLISSFAAYCKAKGYTKIIHTYLTEHSKKFLEKLGLKTFKRNAKDEWYFAIQRMQKRKNQYH